MKEKLIEVLSIQSESWNQWRMFAYIIRQLKSMANVTFKVLNGNIYVAKGSGDARPCIVAHMDTVHKITEDLTVLTVEHLDDTLLTGFDRQKMSQTGIGGDDKVGIFIALEALKHFDNIKAAFFRDEEVGCEGSALADMAFFNSDCSFVLQCDRRGNKDFIHTASAVSLMSQEFKKSLKPILKKHNYDWAEGLMTDVMELKKNGLNVCAANISCGYYRPHEYDEYVSVKDVEKCKNLVFEIIETLGDVSFKHTYVRPTIGFTSHSDWYRDGDGNYTKNELAFLKKRGGYYGGGGESYPRKHESEKHNSVWTTCPSCDDYVMRNELTYLPEYNTSVCGKCLPWWEPEYANKKKENK